MLPKKIYSLLLSFLTILSLIYFYFALTQQNLECSNNKLKGNAQIFKGKIEKIFQQPIVFIGGYPGSGSSIVQSILEIHANLKCVSNVKLLVKFYDSFIKLRKTPQLIGFLDDAGFNDTILDKALGLYSYYIFLKKASNTKLLCNNEAENMFYLNFYKNVFPKSKFLFLLRDGREAVLSVLKRKNQKFDMDSFSTMLKEWNEWNNKAYNSCIKTSPEYCKVIRYEYLISNSQEVLKDLTHFLNLKKIDDINEYRRIILNNAYKVEKSIMNIYSTERTENNTMLYELNYLNLHKN
ncbi:unnamed protein product [Brachionus calyciflorus]|uniref:Protein-tyrosine sulfotransferase n=1 Tax=Brachionus calyciflorus TaxID=104777 RepID=A0A813NH91_9BILA|nr:unnamed protein product [Brachionus calyciflorus]